ncbi:sensor histidine kinase [Roseovarius aestuariivivens]|uniref:sensor histidine kinase n=1 Tax=Roseovarius aestuariivivens TaxID=1888910 RepID=UPI001080F732|nr:ATP-binding protein [Roseovarius aestuariivivens]
MRFSAESIISKSRIYLVALLSILFIGVVVEWRELSRVQTDITRLAARATPLLTTVADLPDLEHELRNVAQSIPALRSEAELDAASDAVASITDRLARLVARAELSPGLPYLAHDLRKLLRTQKRVLAAEARIDARIADARASLDDMVRVLLPLHDTEMRFLLRPPQAIVDPAQRRARIGEAVLVSEMKASVTELSILLGGFHPAARRAGDFAKAELLAEIGAFATRMARLQPGPLQQGLARDLKRFRDAMIGAGGAVETAALLRDMRETRARAVGAVARHVDQVGIELGRASLASATAFETAAQGTADTLRKVLLLKLAMTLGLVMAAAGVLWFFIQKSILVRLAAITEHVRRIAAGDLSEPVPVTGADEIGAIERVVDQSRTMAKALRRTNDELERFSYVAAHDLRSPLRAVADLVEWTKEDYGADLPQGARDNLDMIGNRVRRLSGHLSGLLEYARIGQTGQGQAIFDLTAFAEELRAVFVDAAQFDIVLQDAPVPFLTRPVPVKTILLNLVSNAIKHHDHGRGRIVIACVDTADGLDISVSDDGPGIAPEYHDRIFELFQTLRARDEIEASGMGLALVRKLAATLDGAITVASDPAQARGTTFTLHLPRQPAQTEQPAPQTLDIPQRQGDLAA